MRSAECYLSKFNGDDIEGALAASLDAERLVFLADVEGIRDGDGKLIHNMTPSEIQSLMKSGVIAGGMIPKANAVITALETTTVAQIVDGRLPHALLDAIDGKVMGTTIQ